MRRWQGGLSVAKPREQGESARFASISSVRVEAMIAHRAMGGDVNLICGNAAFNKLRGVGGTHVK